MAKKILSQTLKRSKPFIKEDLGESQSSSWERTKDFIVTLGAASGVLVGVLWMGGRFYAYGYFERMNIPLYFVSFSAGEYAEVYITTIINSLTLYIYRNAIAYLAIIILAVILAIILLAIQKYNTKIKLREALSKIENINNKLFVLASILIFLYSFALAYSSGNEAAYNAITRSRTSTVYSNSRLSLGTSSVNMALNQEPVLYEYKDLYLLTHNNGKYYFFRELDLTTCKPKDIYIVSDNYLVNVNIGESIPPPECPKSP